MFLFLVNTMYVVTPISKLIIGQYTYCLTKNNYPAGFSVNISMLHIIFRTNFVMQRSGMY